MRCPSKVTWTVTWNWLGTANHESHRCIRDAGHDGMHKVRAKNFSRLRRPFGRGGLPAGARDGWYEWR